MDVRTAINRLLAAPDFQGLEERLRDRSIFHLLRVEDREVTHAAFLAWLLDPRGSHGMGSAPLRRLLLLSATLSHSADTLDAADVDGLDLDTVEVVTEHMIDNRRRLDVVVLDEQERPLLIVEYKVDASEGDEQTSDYADWARERALDLDGRRVLPLLVYLCPDRDDETEPAAPFVHVAYEPYCAWLDALQPSNERARLLVREFRACLSQRDDVDAPELQALVDALRTAHADAIQVLAGSRARDLTAVSSILRRHDVVFEKLGIVTGRRRDLGGSAFTAEARSVAEEALDPALWALTGGEGSMVARFQPALEVAKQALGPDARLRLQTTVTRPTRGQAILAFELWLRPLAGLDDSNALRVLLCRDLQGRLADSPLKEHFRPAPMVARVKIPAPGVSTLEDDTPAAAHAARPAIVTTFQMIRDLEPVLVEWCRDRLPALLAPTP